MELPLPLLQPNKPLHTLSTFGIGGNARLFATATSSQQMVALLRFCAKEKLPFFILGKGSNCLFDDRGFNGLVIANAIDFCRQQDHMFHVGSGYSFTRLGQISAKLGFSGLEFAATIPGSVGGALFMNAGAHGQESSQSVVSMHFVTEEGEELYLTKEQISWGYRFSSFQEKKGAITEATFALTPSHEARTKQKELLAYRKDTQPLSERSCGCVFRNPIGYSAGRLIEEGGLKGTNVQGAAVSGKHANFIINTGNATSADVIALIAIIKEKIYKKTGIILQEEIRFVPYE